MTELAKEPVSKTGTAHKALGVRVPLPPPAGSACTLARNEMDRGSFDRRDYFFALAQSQLLARLTRDHRS